MNAENLKWGCIQPLTGGMYIGAQNAIGHPASWILTFDGLDSHREDGDGNVVSAANEYHLLKWLEKQNITVPYYKFKNLTMFNTPSNYDGIEFLLNGEDAKPDFNDMDIVVAVPVCSGLSTVTNCSIETKDVRNSNMHFITNYALRVIKPKIYIFENAPTLMSRKGDRLREQLNSIAKETGYNIMYVKTDTQYHENCQRRPRTFIVFSKDNKMKFDYERLPMSIQDVLNRIPENASLQENNIVMSGYNVYLIDYMEHKYGADWRKHLTSNLLINHIVSHGDFDDMLQYVIEHKNDYSEELFDRTISYWTKKREKVINHLPRWSDDLIYNGDTVNAVMFKTVNNMIHFSENRLYNMREYLNFMGHPHDFEIYGDLRIKSNVDKIGQNVPVRTAQYIVSECIKHYDLNDGDFERTYINNIKQTYEEI